MLVAFPIFSGRIRAIAKGHQRNEQEAQRDSLQHLRPENVPEAGVKIQPRELKHGDRAQYHPDEQQTSRIRFGREMSGQAE